MTFTNGQLQNGAETLSGANVALFPVVSSCAASRSVSGSVVSNRVDRGSSEGNRISGQAFLFNFSSANREAGADQQPQTEPIPGSDYPSEPITQGGIPKGRQR